jgi:hypothetical protein
MGYFSLDVNEVESVDTNIFNGGSVVLRRCTGWCRTCLGFIDALGGLFGPRALRSAHLFGRCKRVDLNDLHLVRVRSCTLLRTRGCSRVETRGSYL